MPLRSADPADEPTLNLTPMIDVVFLLIIFFMIGTQFVQRERQFDVQLPTVSDAQPLTSRPDEIVVNVATAGRVVVRDQELDLEALRQMLDTARQNYPDQAVVVRGSGPDPYQHVMDVLTVCHQAKISHLSLASQLQNEP